MRRATIMYRRGSLTVWGQGSNPLTPGCKKSGSRADSPGQGAEHQMEVFAQWATPRSGERPAGGRFLRDGGTAVHPATIKPSVRNPCRGLGWKPKSLCYNALPKRANSPKGYKASDGSVSQGFFDGLVNRLINGGSRLFIERRIRIIEIVILWWDGDDMYSLFNAHAHIT